jgi:Protein of unknown function (DUF3048) N-terminal domain/Protein of unknown function (DUF3048) C-terminal domain
MPSGPLPPCPAARRRRLLAALSLGLASSLALAACGGGGSDKLATTAKDETPTGSVATANAFTLTGQWPLTGETLSGSEPNHPVYVVKIDNTANSAPQVGLGSADMIVEELVEGGLTRLAVFYDSHIPGLVGPVRSMRASDVGIVKPGRATLVASGAARRTVRVLQRHHVSTMTEGSPGFFRDDNRAAPYNLFMKLTELASHTGAHWKPPAAPYLQFGSDAQPSHSFAVKSMAVTFSGSHTTNWSYDGKGWVRPGSYAESGDDFVADNVLLLRVRIGDAGYLDPAGNPVPETEFYGTGPAILVHGASAVKCTWRKADRAGELRLSTKSGTRLTVPAGHTWIELVPAKTGSVTLHK